LAAQVQHGDDVGVGAQSSHGLSLSGDALAGDGVQALGLDKGEGDVSVQKLVVGEVDLLLAALSQKSLYLVTAICEGGGLLRGRLRANRE